MTARITRRRPRRRRTALLAATGVTVLALAASGCASDPEDDSSPDRRSFALSGKTLTVDSDDSSLELVPTDGDEVEVTRWIKARKLIGSKSTFNWRMEDDRLVLRRDCSGFIATCGVKHRIEVPRGVTLVVKNDDGPVRASGFRTPVDISTDDGSVKVEDISGPLTLRSGDGSIRASDLHSREVAAHTENGSLRLALASVPDRVAARSNDGSVSVTLPGREGDATGYKVSAKSNDGSVKVSVPRDDRSHRSVSAHSDNGSVTVRNVN
ncbi:DUF4097 family beta strand repeat-containing protein [Streptomyces sp. NPDC058171]